MTDADLRALCARVAREAISASLDMRYVHVSADSWHICGPYRPCLAIGGIAAVPLSMPYADADALAAALYDAAKAQGAAEGGP